MSTSRVAAFALIALLAASSGRAGDVTVFVARPDPSEPWREGFGATLGAGILGLGALEVEAVRFAADGPEGDMTSFSGTALIAPSVGPLVPFAGLGLGLYRQSLGSASQTDVVRSFAAGLKINVGRVFVIRGEYRRLTFAGTPLIEMDRRYSLGAGIQF